MKINKQPPKIKQKAPIKETENSSKSAFSSPRSVGITESDKYRQNEPEQSSPSPSSLPTPSKRLVKNTDEKSENINENVAFTLTEAYLYASHLHNFLFNNPDVNFLQKSETAAELNSDDGDDDVADPIIKMLSHGIKLFKNCLWETKAKAARRKLMLNLQKRINEEIIDTITMFGEQVFADVLEGEKDIKEKNRIIYYF